MFRDTGTILTDYKLDWSNPNKGSDQNEKQLEKHAARQE
jgi:hypothetical protein